METISMIWRIYKYTNIITGQSYVGQTTMNVNDRARKDGKGYGQGTPFREAIDKYGFDNFEQSILRLCTLQEEADQYERYFIEKYNSVYPNGYNLESGGKAGQHLHIRTKQNISKSQTELMTVEHRQLISERTKEAMTPEVRQLISERTKEAMNKPEVRQRMSESLKGNLLGTKWWNNGVKNVRAYSCPEGFVPGRLKF